MSDVSELLILPKSNSDVSKSLILLTKNEQPWAIRSSRSEEMSDVSESLILLTKNERMSESLIFLSESLICSFFDKKQAIRSEIKWAIPSPAFKPLKKEESEVIITLSFRKKMRCFTVE